MEEKRLISFLLPFRERLLSKNPLCKALNVSYFNSLKEQSVDTLNTICKVFSFLHFDHNTEIVFLKPKSCCKCLDERSTKSIEFICACFYVILA